MQSDGLCDIADSEDDSRDASGPPHSWGDVRQDRRANEYQNDCRDDEPRGKEIGDRLAFNRRLHEHERGSPRGGHTEKGEDGKSAVGARSPIHERLFFRPRATEFTIDGNTNPCIGQTSHQ